MGLVSIESLTIWAPSDLNRKAVRRELRATIAGELNLSTTGIRQSSVALRIELTDAAIAVVLSEVGAVVPWRDDLSATTRD